MKHDVASFYPRRINQYVPDMVYAADVDTIGYAHMDLGVPVALDVDGILDAESIADAGETSEFAATYSSDAMARYGRNVTVVASGAATSDVTVHGQDYLGQPMSETFTLNGTTGVPGKKAFKHVDLVEFAATADRTINVGWGNVFGLPYATTTLERELVDDITPADAGTFTARVTTDPQTATTGDPRGTYTPHANNISNGARHYKLIGFVVPGNMHGVRHYAA